MSTTRIRRLIELQQQVARLVHETFRQTKEKAVLSPPRLMVLHFVAQHGEPSMKDLADRLCVTPPSTTVMIEPLVASGLLERRPDPRDRRSVRLKLTAKGRRAAAAAQKRFSETLGRVFAPLSKEEQDRLIAILEILIRSHETSQR